MRKLAMSVALGALMLFAVSVMAPNQGTALTHKKIKKGVGRITKGVGRIQGLNFKKKLTKVQKALAKKAAKLKAAAKRRAQKARAARNRAKAKVAKAKALAQRKAAKIRAKLRRKAQRLKAKARRKGKKARSAKGRKAACMKMKVKKHRKNCLNYLRSQKAKKKFRKGKK